MGNQDSTFTIKLADDEILATVTASGDVVSDWIAKILHFYRRHLSHLIIGLDLEWIPDRFYGTYGENPPALLQLCVGHRCLLFQLLYCDYIPDELRDFLSDERFQFVGVAIANDAEKLQREYGLKVRGMVDLRNQAAELMNRPEMRWWGLQRLAREIMGVDMEKLKGVTLSNWGKRVLKPEQIEYAVVDAFVSFEVGRRLYELQKSLKMRDGLPDLAFSSLENYSEREVWNGGDVVLQLGFLFCHFAIFMILFVSWNAYPLE